MNTLPTEVHQKIMTYNSFLDGRSMRLANRLLSAARLSFQYYLDIYLRRRKVDPVRFMSMMKIWQMQLAGSTVLQVINGDYYEKSDFDLYLTATGGKIRNAYMGGNDNATIDEKACREEILGARDTVNPSDDEYIIANNHGRTMIVSQNKLGQFNFIFITDSFQAVFNNYDFDFVKNSYDGIRLQVYDWMAITNCYTHLTMRPRYENYQSLLGTLHRVSRYFKRGFSFSCDEKFMEKIKSWDALSKHPKDVIPLLTII